MAETRADEIAAMQVGASTGALYPHLPTEDAVDTLARLGFPVLEAVLQTAGEYRAEFARLLARRARDAGVRVASVHTLTQLHPLFDPYPRRREEGVDALRRAFALCAELGATCLVWHGLTARDLARGVGWERFRELLGPLAAEAAAAGVRLSLENVSWCAVREADGVRRVRGWGLPVWFTFDPFQAVEAGVDPGATVAAMRGALANVHLSDHAPGEARHLPVGEGTIDWPGVLAEVRAAGYAGPLILEGNCEGDLARLARSRDLARAVLAALSPAPSGDGGG